MIRLDGRLASGDIIATITDPRLDVPTTVDDFAGALPRERPLHHAADAGHDVQHRSRSKSAVARSGAGHRRQPWRRDRARGSASRLVYPSPMGYYDVDPDSFREYFPEGAAIPALFDPFGQWLAGIDGESLGDWVAFAGEQLAEWFPDDGVVQAMRQRLGAFLWLPDGSRLALWYHSDDRDRAPAVVEVGSEGELVNVAASFEAFLLTSVRGTRASMSWTTTAAPPPRRDELRKWLEERHVTPPDVGEVPDFAAWVESLIANAEQAAADGAHVMAAAAAAAIARGARPICSRAPSQCSARCALGRRSRNSAPRWALNLSAIRNGNLLRELARPEHGYSLSFDWPWTIRRAACRQPYPGRRAK